MFVPRKPYFLGNKYHTIVCAKSKVIYNFDIMEGKDLPRRVGKKDFKEKGLAAGLVLRMKNPLWGTGKVVVVDSVFCVMEGLISMVEILFLGSVLIKKQHYWPNWVPAEEII